MTDLQERYATKIAGLLRKAESTTPEEAEALIEKAQALMEKYALEQWMIAQRTDAAAEKIVERAVYYHGYYGPAHFAIGSAIAEANDCKVLVSKFDNNTTLYVLGFESDAERVIMLDSSLQIQARAALAVAEKEEDFFQSWMSTHRRCLQRRTFLIGFAEGLQDRLDRARATGRREYVQERVEDGESAEEVATGLALVVRSRADRLNDWYDQKYGNLKSRGMGGTKRTGSYSARKAGQRAGRNANTGSAGNLRSRKQLVR